MPRTLAAILIKDRLESIGDQTASLVGKPTQKAALVHSRSIWRRQLTGGMKPPDKTVAKLVTVLLDLFTGRLLGTSCALQAVGRCHYFQYFGWSRTSAGLEAIRLEHAKSTESPRRFLDGCLDILVKGRDKTRICLNAYAEG